jgi:hypothetical protein
MIGAKGILQADLASSLAIDPRSLFHLVLRLEKKVWKSPDKTRAGVFTNNLKLAIYQANPPTVYVDLANSDSKSQICRILQKAKNNVAVKNHLRNCITTSTKQFNSAINILAGDGFVARLQVNDRQCIQLLKPWDKSKKEKNPDPVIGEGAALADLPIEHQVYRLISLAGEAGATSNVSSYISLT